MARKETKWSKKKSKTNKSTKVPRRSRIKMTPEGETFYVVRRADGRFKDFQKISRAIYRGSLTKAKTVPKRSGRGHQSDYPKRQTRKKK
jgi:hypothetical protein